ncbi:coiled-coil domain-containing protein 177-like [Bombina bombina]|uniref:coiled-coil domain-containing protein 177-like n=1 Tax=Bombina bombina TaxID=8345 RepID=UPI00235ABCB2|nr:coiled-coil domain-containing protein 177-like [Bombina bombina]
MEDGRRSPTLQLDLYNFEKGHGSRYVLTSPRSLEACSRMAIRPVDLLHRTPEELADEHPGASMRQISEMYEAYEKERRRKVRLCRETRRQLLCDQEEMKSKSLADISSVGTKNPIDSVRKPDYAPTTSSEWWKFPREKAKAPASMCNGEPSLAPDWWDKSAISQYRAQKNQPPLRKSLSMEDLTSSVRKVKQLAREVEREAQVSVSSRDKKIAELMLVKYQEEEMAKKRRVQMEQAWEGAMNEEKNLKAALQKEGWRYLSRSTERQQRNTNARTTWGVKEDNDLEISVGVHGALINQLIDKRMIHAIKAKNMNELQNKMSIKIKNEHEKLRHSRLKEQVDNQTKAQELFKMMSIQQKEQKSEEMYKQFIEERNKELKERAAKEEEQILKAKIRAEHQEREQTKHRQRLVHQTDKRIQQAKNSQEKAIQSKAEKTKELNSTKEKIHHFLKKKINEKEEINKIQVEKRIQIKNRKSAKLLKDKEALVDEGRRIARASFQMREKIREQTRCRTFDQMALQAQLNASLLKNTI